MSDVNVKAVTINSCNLCAPLGAAVTFKGVEKSILLLHGSQGCSTYIRRYLIAHFREPVDIASSSFSENTAVFGGGEQLKKSLDNIISQYNPELIGVATTCLSETIGDDVIRFLKEYRSERAGAGLPVIIPVETAAYKGNQTRGFFKSQQAIIQHLAGPAAASKQLNVFINFISPEDIRHLKRILEIFAMPYLLFPDYSDTLDGGGWPDFYKLPPGGSSVEKLRLCAAAPATLEFSLCLEEADSAGKLLEEEWDVPCYSLPLPIGIRSTDCLMKVLQEQSKRALPAEIAAERGRLLDAYADVHKYVFGKKVILLGDEDLVYSLAAFVSEIGMVPGLCASGGKSRHLPQLLQELADSYGYPLPEIYLDADYDMIAAYLPKQDIDLILGTSKAYKLSRSLNIPLLRIGFPVHDRFGAAARLSLGYLGTRYLLNEIVNILIEHRQAESPVGYTYQ